MDRSIVRPIAARLAAVLLASLFAAGCAPKKPAVAGDVILRETLEHRAAVEAEFRDDPGSPFRTDSGNSFHGLRWFPPDTLFYFQSILHRYATPEHLTIYGTKGEERPMMRYGYFLLSYDGKEYPLNVYKLIPADPSHPTSRERYLSVWFTDETTGRETYNVGRYVDVGEESGDPQQLYTLNFNNAYNPYCAYSPRYTCAVPTKDDHLPFAVRAGEMKFHP